MNRATPHPAGRKELQGAVQKARLTGRRVGARKLHTEKKKKKKKKIGLVIARLLSFRGW